MGVLHSRPIEREFHGNGVGGNLLQLIRLVVVVLLPFVVAFATGHFWLKERLYTEQADVTFLNKVLMVARGADEEHLAVWCSLPGSADLLGDLYYHPSFEYHAEDVNGDSIADRFHFKLQLPLPETFRVSSVDVLFFFNWKASQIVDIDMESMAHISHTTPVPMERLDVRADLIFAQREPLIISPFVHYDKVYKVSRFDTETISSVADMELERVVDVYARRNESTVAKVTGLSWDRQAEWGGGDHVFEVDLLLQNPPSVIIHLASLAEVMKFGLVQYFVLWYIFGALFGYVRAGLVEGGVVNTYATCPDLDDVTRRLRRLQRY